MKYIPRYLKYKRFLRFSQRGVLHNPEVLYYPEGLIFSLYPVSKLFAEAISENSSATDITQWATLVLQLTKYESTGQQPFCILCGVLLCCLLCQKVKITCSMWCKPVWFLNARLVLSRGLESCVKTFYIGEENLFFLSLLSKTLVVSPY